MHSATDGFFFLSDSLLRQLIRWKLALVDQMFCQESIHLRSIILHPSSMTHKTCHLNPFHGPAQPNALWPVKLPFPDLLELSQPEDVAMENAKLQPGTLQPTNEIISVPPRPTAKYHASRSLAMASLSSRRRLSSTLPTKHTPIHKQSNKQLLHITITPCLLIIQLIKKTYIHKSI